MMSGSEALLGVPEALPTGPSAEMPRRAYASAVNGNESPALFLTASEAPASAAHFAGLARSPWNMVLGGAARRPDRQGGRACRIGKDPSEGQPV